MKEDTFIEECRSEWKRLGVPDDVAGEMAAELRADLADAAAEDVPAEELLGAGAHDARGFAASWASERGVVPTQSKRRVGLLAGAGVALAAIAVSAGLLSARSTNRQVPTIADATPRRLTVVDPATGRVTRRLVYQLTSVGQHRTP